MPGPGSYDSPHKLMGSNSISYTMGTKKETQIKESSPGPGNYDPNFNATKDKIRAYDMGKSVSTRNLASKE
jgi:hypothetical protein